MEKVNEAKEKTNESKIILIMGLMLVLGFVGGYLFFGCDSKKELDENKTEKKDIEQSDINDIKKWVVDANYVTTDLLKLYQTANESINDEILEELNSEGLKEIRDGEEYNLFEDIKKIVSRLELPYFNIDSEAANLANEEIQKQFDNRINAQFPKWYDDNSIDRHAALEASYSEYRSHVYENVLSVVVNFRLHGMYDCFFFSLTYNFDLNTGELLTYEEVYELLGFSSDNIDEKVRKAIESIYTDEEAVLRLVDDHIYRHLNEFLFYRIKEGTDFSQEIDNTYQSYLHNLSGYFIDENNNLNIVVEAWFPVQDKVYEAIILIE